MKRKPFDGTEKRTYTRVAYPPGKGPTLLYKSHRFVVTDISERGLGFVNNANVRLPKQIRATVIFANGRTFAFEGAVVRKENHEVGIYFGELMPQHLVIEQQASLLKLPS